MENMVLWLDATLTGTIATSAAIATGIVITIYFVSTIIKFVQNILQ